MKLSIFCFPDKIKRNGGREGKRQERERERERHGGLGETMDNDSKERGQQERPTKETRHGGCQERPGATVKLPVARKGGLENLTAGRCR